MLIREKVSEEFCDAQTTLRKLGTARISLQHAFTLQMSFGSTPGDTVALLILLMANVLLLILRLLVRTGSLPSDHYQGLKQTSCY